MAALLVALAVMAVLMSAALPVWKHDARRAKEAELVWRGQQYVRAIRLFSAHMGGAFPPSIDALVSGHYLRKAYKDPITNDDFQVIGAGNPMPGQPSGGSAGTIGSAPQPGGGAMSGQSPVMGGVIGVVSKSKDESILVYLGRTHYNEWTFVYVNQRPTSAFPGNQPPQPGQGQPSGPGRGFPGRGRGFTPGAQGNPNVLSPIRRGGGGL